MKGLFFPFTCSLHFTFNTSSALCSSEQEARTTQRHMPLNPTVRTMTRININLPMHVVRQLFFALRRVGGMRHGPIRHHGQRRSVFERLGPRARRSAVNGSGCGRIFASAVRNLRQDAR